MIGPPYAMGAFLPGEKMGNPMWDELVNLQRLGKIDIAGQIIGPRPGFRNELDTVLARYSRVVSDPAIVEWVHAHLARQVVQIDAGTGYWAALMAELGHDVTAYGRGERIRTFYDLRKLQRNGILAHDAADLLAVAPEKWRHILASVQQYRGPRLVLVGSDDMLGGPLGKVLSNAWTVVGETPGIHRRTVEVSARVFARRGESGSWSGSPTQLLPILSR